MADILERLETHSEYFSSMLALIPGKYLATTDEQPSGKYFRNKRERAPKQLVKEATKRAKKMRLDPEYSKSEPPAGDVADKGALPDALQKFNVASAPSKNLSDLRERLRNKIEKLQASRREAEKQKKQPKENSKKKKTKKQRNGVSSKTLVAKEPAKKPANVKANEKMVFSKFDFTVSNEPSDVIAKHKKVDYKRLLAKAEAQERSLKDMKKRDVLRSEELEEKINWKRALSKAKGEKMKDDTGLLKKSMRRKESQKRSSKKKWQSRNEHESERKDQRQETRKKNIQERIGAKKAKNTAKRKGRTPGF